MATTRLTARAGIASAAAGALVVVVLLWFRPHYRNVGHGPGEKPALQALEHPSDVAVYRLGAPVPDGMGDAMPRGMTTQHGYTVIRGNRAGDPARVTRAVKDGFVDGDTVGACFEPHHMVRVGSQGMNFDFLVSYHCQQTVVYVGEEKVAVFPTKDVQVELEEAFQRSGL